MPSRVRSATLWGVAGALAFLREKIDMSIQTPDDIKKRIGIQILGTTTSSENFERALLPQQITDDYQNICTNLGLMSDKGIPEILAVTSPGPREGKTTFSINLGISIARAGKKVLVIDGDLRKADVARLVKIEKPENGLKRIVEGEDPERMIISSRYRNLDILTAKPCSSSDIYDIISKEKTAEVIEELSKRYKHIIIDTPPVLAASDALLWSKLSRGVILTGFARYTEGPDMKEAVKRLQRVEANIVGIVLNNVSYESYHPYSYGYSRHKHGDDETMEDMLLLPEEQE